MPLVAVAAPPVAPRDRDTTVSGTAASLAGRTATAAVVSRSTPVGKSTSRNGSVTDLAQSEAAGPLCLGDIHRVTARPDAARTAWTRALTLTGALGLPDTEPLRAELFTRLRQDADLISSGSGVGTGLPGPDALRSGHGDAVDVRCPP
ncbi:hypothetical protein OHS59_42950 [Streptomyces sp. NBC_00414]|uniref:hypothetical protein n=1 Tax=Streptomyces sp. NBC_00414 TaxID=2975739 RepID=UPI002E1D2BBA